MKVFNIVDEEINLFVGNLLYFEKDKSFVVELSNKLDEWTAPLLFTSFVKQGVFTIPRDISALFVRERIVPKDRQNIQSILNTHKINEYDELKLLQLSQGRCSQDNLYIKEVASPSDFVLERMQKNLLDFSILKDNRLLCIFADYKVKLIHLDNFTDIPQLESALNNPKIYESISICPGGYALSLFDNIDIPSWLLYERGNDTGLGFDDILLFFQNNILDTGTACKQLNCSRQNLSYLISKDLLNPIKENVNGKLFLKGDLEKLDW